MSLFTYFIQYFLPFEITDLSIWLEWLHCRYFIQFCFETKETQIK